MAAAPDTRTRTRPSRAQTDATVEIRKQDLQELVDALRRARDGETNVRLPQKSGALGDVAKVFNQLSERREGTATELRRLSRVIGREGRMTERATLRGAKGSWRDTIESVNTMIDDLVRPTIEVARVLDAVAEGDLSQKMSLRIDGRPVRGEFHRIGTTVNAMLAQLSSFASEVTRVAREVGTDGVLGGQARVKGVSGIWRELTDNVNFMASNLTSQVRNIADVTTAVAQGDLTKQITVDAKGEVLELKNTINTMVDQLSSFADEVTRVAREVGTEGILGGQANVEGVSGTWKDLTDNVNFMASNLTTQVRGIAKVVTAVADGNLRQKFTVEAKGEVAALADTINSMIDTLRVFADQVTGVAREVGTEGVLGGQADVPNAAGTWRGLTDNVNSMANNLTTQVRNIAEVTTAVARGDLSRKITVEAKGEVAELAETINTMVDQLSSFAAEVTRVAKEVGTEGRLGGQAEVEGVSGTWRDLTDNVNQLADNLTSQVRNIAEVTTAVAQGDLSKKITVEARGEVLEVKETVNTMVDQLRRFAAEVTRVAREVGREGKLGVLAQVEGVSGVWKGLTDNVNQLAGTLTTQLRAISEVSQAVTQGDLTRSIAVEAEGEVAELKDTINQMIVNLAATTRANEEQDWLNSNLARFTGMLQGLRDLETVSRLIMSELTPLVGAQHGAFFMRESDGEGEELLRLIASYGYKERKNVPTHFALGEGLVGQSALEMKPILLTEAPDDYIRITSGLGDAAPINVIVLPVLFEDQVMAVIEIASLVRFSGVQQAFLEQLSESIGVVLNTIIANMRTEELLAQSQDLTQELQSQSEELQAQQEELQQTNKELEEQAASLKASEELLQTQQEELQQTNEELEEKAQLLEEQNRRIEIKNREIELARAALEEKAEQLALSSRYKSEFLANMSHELRTPLNSLLILAKLLGENPDENLTDKQIEFAQTIHSAGSDLLDLINDILDLSKVEAGRMDVNLGDVKLADVREFVERSFRPVADDRGLGFDVEVHGANVPPTLQTDEQRLQQVLKNLLSNAFKFTESGGVRLRVEAAENRQFASEALSRADAVLAFSVTDTGIGIPEDKLRLIFEAFQQADGTTSRRYGGTGLGLSISREIARLLGGEIHVESRVGHGSTFTLFLPATHPRGSGEAAPVELDEIPFLTVAPAPEPPELDPAMLLPSEVEDDRDDIREGDRVVLIVEDDAGLASTELEVARDRGFKGIVALRGDSGLALAHEFKPDAIILDMNLPVMDGWTVLDHLKHHPETRHIPVHIVSGGDGRTSALRAGAVAFLEKPVSKEGLDAAFGDIESFIARGVKNLLVVEDDEQQRTALTELIGGGEDVDVTAVGSSEEALEALEQTRFDCMVVDLKLPEMGGFELLERLNGDVRFSSIPVIVYTGKELTRREETKLKKFSDAIVVKDASSPERLLDETALFLHRVERKLPQEKRRMLEQLHSADDVFRGRRILIVDDDVRNVFALTSVLEASGMDVVYAENGREGIETLRDQPEIDLVLMDIMMPEMDGYETIRAIRADDRFDQLPIISLTAKAMKGDREKSIAVGASDYITKPVDTDQLLSLMRVWLYK